MKLRLMYSVLGLSLIVSGCSSHHFVNKTGQTEKQFIQDKAYCQGLATGQGGSRSEGERLIPYDECMRNLGYELK